MRPAQTPRSVPLNCNSPLAERPCPGNARPPGSADHLPRCGRHAAGRRVQASVRQLPRWFCRCRAAGTFKHRKQVSFDRCRPGFTQQAQVGQHVLDLALARAHPPHNDVVDPSAPAIPSIARSALVRSEDRHARPSLNSGWAASSIPASGARRPLRLRRSRRRSG